MKQGVMLAIILIIISSIFWLKFPSDILGSQLEISKDGEVLGTYSLNKDQIIWVVSEENNNFTLEDKEIIEYYNFDQRLEDIKNPENIDYDKILEKSGKKVELNMVIIKDKEAHVYEANCPTKLCAKQGVISNKGETITCAPHKLVIKIKGESKIDG
jgi:hypothetical protein